MKAEIITVGTELLIGSILNTNAKFLSERLIDLGVDVVRQVSVADDMNSIIKELNISMNEADLIFLCGGLGPTNDDLTREALAKFLNKKIYIDKDAKEKLVLRFEKINKKMTDNNIKQVSLIEGSKKLDNNWGLALGEVNDYNGKKIFLFPGPPKEFEPMVDAYLAQNIHENQKIIVMSLNVIGLGESLTEDRIRKLNLENKYISINTFAHFTQTEIKLIAKGEDYEYISNIMSNSIEKLYDEFKDHIYSDNNQSVEEVLVKRLMDKNLTISFAESITGGLLAASITDVAGSSKILSSSYVTYSNDSKIKNLGVRKETLDKYGAISEQTALEMACGLKNKTNSSVCVSTTGEAGPEPSETDIGNVFICIYFSEDNYQLKHFYFPGNRERVRNRTVSQVLSNLLYLINKE
ncbi:competence/damage-inducible protein A [Peptoniphilus lacrimalis]|uniref:competence/damage-inducible protein A n=2 Tax=Peptoniphilus TaxID=162289 RepID=UPI00254ACA2A|nr:competence/damage-inducible protein A [Peptoniphilus lacrimalis]MDK7722019.1 competence/damage-inducible protein A [Peptoniphilus lacrimalis]MDK7731735.1 competence/damage-inducible protein A [Peptoniphilus lacrimalis]